VQGYKVCVLAARHTNAHSLGCLCALEAKKWGQQELSGARPTPQENCHARQWRPCPPGGGAYVAQPCWLDRHPRSQRPRGTTRSRRAAALVGKIPQDAKPADMERVDEIFYDLSFARIMVPDSNASPYQWPPLVVGPHDHRRATSLVRLMPEAFSRLRRLIMVEYLTDDEPENRNCHKVCNAIARGWIASSNRRSR
jgi:hypothetical protein